MKSNNNSIKYVLISLVILSFSTFLPTIALAAPLASNDKDWQYVNGNSWAWNYSPQTQINKDNVQNLEVKWIYPIESKAGKAAGIQSLTLLEGSTTPPVVRDGVVYIQTNWKRHIAIDAITGKQIWTYDYTLNLTTAAKRLPISITSGGHSHGTRYWEGGDAIIDMGMACDIYAVNAKTGKENFRIDNLCLNIPGNIYNYQFRGLPFSANVGTYEKGRQFIVVFAGSMHSSLNAPDARHVTMGVSMDAPYNVQWRVFSAPPQDVLAKDWALQECNTGFFRDIPCSQVAAVNTAGLEWDFAAPNQKPNQWGGVTANWGQPVIDEDTGILYTQTGNQGPYSNMSLVPGPRLYGSTIMAIDMNQGKRIWWLQPFPHDPYDYDCNWSGILTENPTLGKVYIKGCKEGIFYVMDAKTGQPKYKVDVRPEQLSRGQISTLSYQAYAPDPKSFHDMREWNWISYPAAAPGIKGEHFTLPGKVYPDFYNGIFATDMSFDPQTNTLILKEDALETTITKEFPYVPKGSLFTTQANPNSNSTIVARDMATGKVKWTYFTQYSHQRAANVVSGGMVFSGFTDGYLRFLDKDTGKLLHSISLGSPVVVQPTIGKDKNGNAKIFTIFGATRLAGNAEFGLAGTIEVPGTLIALGLSDKAPIIQTSTVTTTSTATTTATSTTTSISTSATTVVSIQQTTITSVSTESVGLPAEVTYGAVGIALVAIVAAAVMMTRKRA